MSLVWHIVRKDIQRLWLPLGLWLALVLAQTLLAVHSMGLVQVTVSSYEGLSYFVATWGVILGVVGFVLAAWLVMEDNLVSTQAGWRTRPINGARLLAAKSLGALLMFSVLPAAVLTPVWLGCGFSAGEWAGAAGALMLRSGLISAAAFALAGITETSGQFLLRAIGAAVLLPLFVGYVSGAFARPGGDTPVGVAESRSWLLLAIGLLTPLVMLGHQFLTRRTLRTVAIFGAGVVLMLGVKFAWVWDFSSPGSGPGSDQQAAAAAADPEVKFRVTEQTESSADAEKNGDASFQARWSGVMAGAPAGSFLRLDSARGLRRRADQSLATVGFKVTAGRQTTPPESAVRVAAGLPGLAEEPATWAIESDQTDPRGLFQVRLTASLLRGRVLGELPLRPGAELHTGSSLTRIVSIERTESGLVVQLEECDAWFAWLAGMDPEGPDSAWRNSRRVADGFVLLNPAHTYVQSPAVAVIGTIRVNSLQVYRRELTVTPPTTTVAGVAQETPGWEEGLVIMKVRFSPDHPLTRLISR